jgi:hypothetical protein
VRALPSFQTGEVSPRAAEFRRYGTPRGMIKGGPEVMCRITHDERNAVRHCGHPPDPEVPLARGRSASHLDLAGTAPPEGADPGLKVIGMLESPANLCQGRFETMRFSQ